MTQMPPVMTGGGMRPHRGTMILVFGMLSWFVCFIFGILAWVMGNSDLREMAEGRMDPSGEGMTKAGKIIGMVHIFVAAAAVVVMLILMMLGVFAAGVAGAAGAGGGGGGP